MVRIVTLSLFLLASVNLGLQILFEQLEVEDTSTGRFVIMCGAPDPVDLRARILIEGLLLVAVLSTRAKRHVHTILTAVSLLGVLAVYLSWWQYVFRLAVKTKLPVGSLNHFGYLWKGNPFDLLIAATTASLVLWHIAKAFKSFLRTDETQLQVDG